MAHIQHLKTQIACLLAILLDRQRFHNPLQVKHYSALQTSSESYQLELKVKPHQPRLWMQGIWKLLNQSSNLNVIFTILSKNLMAQNLIQMNSLQIAHSTLIWLYFISKTFLSEITLKKRQLATQLTKEKILCNWSPTLTNRSNISTRPYALLLGFWTGTAVH